MKANFNPLPRKEGDSRSETKAAVRRISIHSLVKRETDKADKEFSRKLYHFNPLPRKEGDTLLTESLAYGLISIHSLVKRETFRTKERAEQVAEFQSTPS